jgi:transcription elongation factor GreA
VDKSVTIENAIESYITERNISGPSEQAELRRFERWVGKSRLIAELSPLDIEHYAERISASDPEYGLKQESIRKFLTNARNKGWLTGNLAVHVKAKKGKTPTKTASQTISPDRTVLTEQGYEDILKELKELKERRPVVLDEIRRAAADKDFRENAPLHAAREQLGYIDGRMKELTLMIKSANIIGRTTGAVTRVGLGSTFTIAELESGKLTKFTIVGPKEADPSAGKISHVSPIGKAALGKNKGDEIQVSTPAGNRRYLIKEIHDIC